MDKYTKIILTVIAILLALQLAVTYYYFDQFYWKVEHIRTEVIGIHYDT